ncbi:hypothetical protein DFJ67_2932 [Asanoa ferruginea]|uniref:Polyketide cyclase/dehydrase/lipid transport protein n=1 Tax=Asanoa ferruginea TaxID=53367 RepID=A0A3D9ZHR7_9ACTN|nr:hypothetical protein [Asanoa ferruginea]REF96938.1 hypothetical protein DFJ67_2932 [Asanoa ferruginea]GIF49709.1 hypothetical protein Afe04nite_42480 [Asanoa ferruginea]
MGRLLLTLEGVVEAPIDRVAEVALVEQPGASVDRAARTIVMQGDWWFRSETALHADGPGRTRIVQRIFNVAEKGRWAVRFVAREPLRAAQGGFDARLAEFGRRLGCRSYRVREAARPG